MLDGGTGLHDGTLLVVDGAGEPMKEMWSYGGLGFGTTLACYRHYTMRRSS